MARDLKDFYETAQTEPVMTTVGRGIRNGMGGVARAAKNAAWAANESPKLIGVPAAGVANFAGKRLAELKSGIQGRPIKAPEYQALTLGQMLDGGPAAKPAAAAPAPAPAATQPAAPVAEPTDLPGIDGVKDWSGAQVVNTRFASSKSQPKWEADTGNSPIAQFYRAQQGEAAPAAQPTSINVRRQANGVLEFSGSGGGDGTGAVTYKGLPGWKSAQGGAGQGSADFGGEAFKPAQAALAQGPGNPLLERYQQLADQVASGGGGIVSALQARSALRALGPIIERQMANDNATGIARMEDGTRRSVAQLGAETQRRGQDLGLRGELARVNASIYGTDVGARTAHEGHEIEKERNALSMSVAKAKATGNPLQVRQAMLLELEWTAKTGLDINTGEPISEDQRRQYEQRIMAMKTPQTVVPYGGYGMATGDE